MIPFLDLQAQYLNIKEEIDSAVINCLSKSQYVLGPPVDEFEKQFATYCGVSHAMGVGSGAAALHLALIAAGVGPGDEVITVSMTFVATVAAILYCGATPVLVDVDPITWNMDATKIKAAITSKTKAILPVHLHGRMAEMDTILSIAKEHNLIVIEDAAQAHGAKYKGKLAGTFGDLSCFSFYPGKNLGAYGEAGAVVTNNDEYAKTIRQLRDWGQTLKYQHDFQGFNYRMDAIQGAVLNIKLKHLNNWTNDRRSRAEIYDEYLDTIKVSRPATLEDYHHVYHVYAINLKNRAEMRDSLLEQGVATNIHYPIPVHLQKGYKDVCVTSGELRVTEQLANETLSLPLYPELTDEHVLKVCNVLEAVLNKSQVEELC